MTAPNQNIDYDACYAHIHSLKKVVLVTTGRTGSDFFQSLLDGHHQIGQFTGIWYFHQFWEKAICKSNLDDLIDEFIWHTATFPCITKFKSEYNTLERWDQLGENKNENFQVDIDLFKKHLRLSLQRKPLTSESFFVAVHLAYSLSIGQNLFDIRILFYHIHHIEKLEQFASDFEDFDVICTIRDPRNTICSGLEHRKAYNPKSFSSSRVRRIFKRVFIESESILSYTKNVFTLKLEDLHLFSKEVLKEFCSKYDLEHNESIMVSSYHGKQWWGDQLSGKYLDGFNPNIVNRNWQGQFYIYENTVLEFLLYQRLKKYKYLSTTVFRQVILFPIILLLIPLPLKFEIRAFFFRIREDSGPNRFLYNSLSFAYNYIQRVILFYQYLFKRLLRKEYISQHFYSLPD